jgi:hypothetical protein
MTISFGMPAASGHEADRVAVVLPVPFCESLSELLVENGGVDPAAQQASVVIEIVMPYPAVAPLDPVYWEPVGASSFMCQGPEPGTESSGLAIAP